MLDTRHPREGMWQRIAYAAVALAVVLVIIILGRSVLP